MVFLCFNYIFTYHKGQSEISDLDACVLDDAIEISWSSPSILECKELNLEIYDGETLVESTSFTPLRQKYTFRNGTHGTFYTIKLNNDCCYSMFLDFDRLPDIPVININTLDGDDPYSETAQKPNPDYFGETIDFNEYKKAQITVSKGHNTVLTDSAEIKVRGNTSSAWMMKKSYKIKLKHPADLLDDNDRIHTDWVLLNSGVNINTYVGNYIGDKLNMEWNPHSTWVNVILNGDWKGCYFLTEPLDYESNPVGIADDGYIFENGSYFWKHNQEYFTLNNQMFGLGYSFVYPKLTTVPEPNAKNTRLGTKEDLEYIHSRMQALEDSLLNTDTENSITYDEIIDIDSFARWILARDIMGNEDGGGTNMYFYMKNHNSKIQMGPLWDFDNLFMRTDRWSANHDENIFYFPQLMNQKEFYDSYNTQWKNIEDSLVSEIAIDLNNLQAEKGVALNESWVLDETRWQYDESHWPAHVTSITDQINEAINWFTTRKVWIDANLE